MTFVAAIEEFKLVVRADPPVDADEALRLMCSGLIELTTALEAEVSAVKETVKKLDKRISPR